MFDDFFCEPSEFDERIEEFKESLRDSVKNEITQEIERLREENASLWEIRNNWNAKVQELEASVLERKMELNKAIRAAEATARDAKRMRLKELLAEYPVFAYSVHIKYVEQPKCDLCDKDRKRPYITPLGRTAYEDCTCKKTKKQYYIKRVPLVEIAQGCRDNIFARYLVAEECDESYMRYASEFFDETPFEKTNTWKPLFRNETRARLFVAWLNSKEEEKK